MSDDTTTDRCPACGYADPPLGCEACRAKAGLPTGPGWWLARCSSWGIPWTPVRVWRRSPGALRLRWHVPRESPLRFLHDTAMGKLDDTTDDMEWGPRIEWDSASEEMPPRRLQEAALAGAGFSGEIDDCLPFGRWRGSITDMQGDISAWLGAYIGSDTWTDVKARAIPDPDGITIRLWRVVDGLRVSVEARVDRVEYDRGDAESWRDAAERAYEAIEKATRP